MLDDLTMFSSRSSSVLLCLWSCQHGKAKTVKSLLDISSQPINGSSFPIV
jgi:hypothetical protein